MRQPTPDVLSDILGPAPAQPSTISIDAIRIDGGTQMRAGVDEGTVQEYYAAMKLYGGWGQFPAVTVDHDGDQYWLGDGFHRIAAYQRLLVEQPSTPDTVPADIRAGTRRDAILHAAQANARHGLRRSQADKRRAVETLLRDDQWRQWSDREIARRCAVSADLVGAVRRELYPPAPAAPATVTVVSDSEPSSDDDRTYVRTYTSKHGTTATMQVDNIGKSQPAYVAVWAIESRVISVIERSGSRADMTQIHADQLRQAARTPGCALMREIEARLDEHHLEFRRQDIVQAMHNVASQIEQEYRRKIKPAIAVPITPAAPAGNTEPLSVRQLIEKIHACVPQFYTEPHEEAAMYQDIMACAVTRSGGFWKYVTGQITNFQEDTMRQAMQIVSGELAERARLAYMEENGRRNEEHFAKLKAELNAASTDDATGILTPVSMRDGYDGDEWYTPEEIIRTAAGVMLRIDCDPATCELAQTVVQAGSYYTKFDDGLSQPWSGNVWLNPPYSNPQIWIDKLFAELDAGHTRQAIVLVNNATETSWFQRLLADAKLVCFPSRRLAFWRHDHSNVGARQGQALFYFGSRAEVFQGAFCNIGAVLRRVA